MQLEFQYQEECPKRKKITTIPKDVKKPKLGFF